MSNWPSNLDPNLVEVLTDLRKDSRTRLFSLDLSPLSVSVLDDMPSASAGTAGWTPAERHLLERYREEAAGLLKDAFRKKVVENEATRLLVPTAQPLSNGSAERAGRFLASRKGEGLSPETRNLLDELASGSSPSSSGFDRLASTAAVLDPSSESALFVALGDLFQGSLDDSLKGFLAVTESAGPRGPRSLAWINAGLVYSMRGQFRDSLCAFVRASLMSPDDARGTASAFSIALDAGDENAALFAAERLDDRSLPTDWIIEEFVRSHRWRMARGQYETSAEWLDVVRRIKGRLGPVTGHIIDEILDH